MSSRMDGDVSLRGRYIYDGVCILSSALMVLSVAVGGDVPGVLLLSGLVSLWYRVPRVVMGTPGVTKVGFVFWLDVVCAMISLLACAVVARREDVGWVFLVGWTMCIGLACGQVRSVYVGSFLFQGFGHLVVACVLLRLLKLD